MEGWRIEGWRDGGLRDVVIEWWREWRGVVIRRDGVG